MSELPTYDLSGTVALVTGAGSGIGRAAALLLAERGAVVGAVGRTESQLAEVVALIDANGGTAEVLVADVAVPDALALAVDRLVTTHGRLDAVFANAGINGVWAPVEEIEVDEWDQVVDINLKGTFLTAKFTVPHLKRAGGSLIICSSVQGTRMFSVTGSSVYAATKAAQVAFTKKLAVELGPSKVRVNVICPGWIRTEIRDNTYPRNLEEIAMQPPNEAYPRGRNPLTGREPGEPEQVAEVVAFLASRGASHVSGTEIWVDGGESLVVG